MRPEGDARVAAAWKALDATKRPEGMAPMTWASVWMLLHRLCRYARYDVIRPTQEQLADELDVPRPTVQRLLTHAEAHGLITRHLECGEGRWHYTEYDLRFLPGANRSISAPPSEGCAEAERSPDERSPGDHSPHDHSPHDHSSDRHTISRVIATRSPKRFPFGEEENGSPSGNSNDGPPLETPSDREEKSRPTTVKAALAAGATTVSEALASVMATAKHNEFPSRCRRCSTSASVWDGRKRGYLGVGEGYLVGKEPVCGDCYRDALVTPDLSERHGAEQRQAAERERAHRAAEDEERQAAWELERQRHEAKREAERLAAATAPIDLEDLTLADLKALAAEHGLTFEPRTRPREYIAALLPLSERYIVTSSP